MGGIFANLETVELREAVVKKNLYEIMLQHCGNLKRLHLSGVDYGVGDQQEIPDSWITKKYPKLEYLELAPITSIDDLIVLFKNSHNIRSFSTDFISIWDNKYELSK